MHASGIWFIAALAGAKLASFACAILAPYQTSTTSLESSSTSILLAARDDFGGQAVLNEWEIFMKNSIVHPPKVWVMCLSNTSTESFIRGLPSLLPFVVEKRSSWATVLQEFSKQNPDATVFGLLGEGTLPYPDLAVSVKSVEFALAENLIPKIVLSRSRLRLSNGSIGGWLPDTFISQLWCNHNQVMIPTGFGMEENIHDLSLIAMLPQIIRKLHSYSESQLVDGTSILTAMYIRDLENGRSVSERNGAAANGQDLYIGRLESALVIENDGRNANIKLVKTTISRAPWPPQYILKTVAKDGIVIVSNVNCGYLDLAVNFLRSVQRVSDSKVFWVAMDDVAYDFMDSLSPGSVAMFPFHGTAKPHATKAGDFGDDVFKEEVLVRPSILKNILKQRYALLWTDSDMVWLNNVMATIPNANDPSGADLMLMLDGGPESPCTCLLFMKPVNLIKKLLNLWKNEIMQTEAQQDQAAWKHPLILELFDGMRMDVFRNESFPSGRFYFDHPFKANDPAHENVMVVHNNWIIGHDEKVRRFKEYQLWDVGNIVFPSCDRRF